MKKQYLALALMTALSSVGCGDDKEDASSTTLEITGDYVDQFMGEQHITATKWNKDAIVDHDNGANEVYLQFPDDAEFNPGKFGKNVYIEPEKDGSFYFCSVVFDADTLEDAKASDATADDSDPENGGCGGPDFSWTHATKQ